MLFHDAQRVTLTLSSGTNNSVKPTRHRTEHTQTLQ